MSPTITRFTCAYCGTTQTWAGEGRPVCKQCGATQAAREAAVVPLARKHYRTGLLVPIAVVLVAAGGSYYYHKHQKVAVPVASPVAAKPIAVAPDPPVTGSRIQRVDNPQIRRIPKGVDVTAQDLLDSAHNPPAPAFDAQQLLAIKMPRRITDEEHNTGYLGEVTNTSADQVAIAPQATVILTKNGKEVDRATHDFPDLVPGQHVPLFFGYDGDPTAFDTIKFVWRPTWSYTLGAPRHGQLVATVETKSLERGENVLNFNQVFHYRYVHVTGTLENKGPGKAGNIRLFVMLRDAKGEMTGYERQDKGDLDSGATGKFEINVVQWGAPGVTVDAIAMPTSPPPL
ncbi:MAG TPA: FxLYD domain-containing protein [Aliidongia sp.]|uniref:FxLYD domain-containing protein n=1 Tax=Aliidongia sp. TaxID=1914230 RepID=UPI002DDD721F|nr:FxLYD domain-containing protein [Aliidongia sp.]HEV2675367.1 FxLYD domain-containing protein [Aliidongia sp.]